MAGVAGVVALHICVGIGSPRPSLVVQNEASARQIAVLPFRDLGETKETAGIGIEIAEELTNTLSKLQGFSILDQGFQRQVSIAGPSVGGSEMAEELANARRLGIDILVTGACKKTDAAFHLDCWIYDVATGERLDGKSFALDGKFPADRVTLLRELPAKVEKALSPSAASTSRQKPMAAAESSLDVEAHQLFAAGLQASSSPTKESLESAIELFQQALAKDANYAQVYAAKADAEIQLATRQKKEGLDIKKQVDLAVQDATDAVESAPYFGLGHWQLSRALALKGDFAGSTRSARVAAQLLPADGAVYVDLCRALNQGKITDGPEIQRAITMAPALSLVVPELPKITVQNEGTEVLKFKFAVDGGERFASVDVLPGGSRVVGLVPGHYAVTTIREGVSKTVTQELGSGTTYYMNDRAIVTDHTTDVGGMGVRNSATDSLLTVTSNIRGARVSIDGINIGTTPVTRSVGPGAMSDGNFNLLVTAPGYKPNGAEVHLSPGTSQEIPIDLTRDSGPSPGDPIISARSPKKSSKTGLMMVPIARATFTMGDSSQADNQPHSVTLSAFSISQYPVTIKQFRAFTDASDGYRHALGGTFDWSLIAANTPDDHPMVNVTYSEASAYCQWAGGVLPTEAQWEYAARGPKGYRYPWSNDWSPDKLEYNNRTGTAAVTAHPAGASYFGCYDMEGNVWQWCRDGYTSNIARNVTDPMVIGEPRVIRGCAFGSDGAKDCMAAVRGINPGSKRSDHVGFRVAWPFG